MPSTRVVVLVWCTAAVGLRSGGSGGAVTLLAGSMRILACRSGSPRAAKAAATPSSPTVPVTMGVASTSPSASWCSASRSSSGV